MSKISIVVPVYNVSKYLDECIDSILKQSYEDFELILVDDGSKDNSFEICQAYQEKDARVKAFSKPNGGVSTARNFGISKATGKYITFIDSDDYVASNYCEALFNHISENVDMVVLGLQKAYSNGRIVPINHRFSAGKYAFNDILEKIVDDGTLSGFTFHSSCAILYKLDIINNLQLKFREDIKFNEDGLFNTEYVLKTKCSVYVDYKQYVYFYRTNLESATSSVNVFDDRFKGSMTSVEEALNGYKAEFACIEQQLARRAATIALSQLLYLVGKDFSSIKLIKQILSDTTVRQGFALLDYSTMGNGKRMLCYAVRAKQYWIISLVLKMRARRK